MIPIPIVKYSPSRPMGLPIHAYPARALRSPHEICTTQPKPSPAPSGARSTLLVATRTDELAQLMIADFAKDTRVGQGRDTGSRDSSMRWEKI